MKKIVLFMIIIITYTKCYCQWSELPPYNFRIGDYADYNYKLNVKDSANTWLLHFNNAYGYKADMFFGNGTYTDGLLHIRRGSAYAATSSLFGGTGSMLNQSPEAAYALSSELSDAGSLSGSETAKGGMGFIFVTGTDAHNLRIGTETNHKVIFRTNNIDRVTISNGGSFGIGTLNPSGITSALNFNMYAGSGVRGQITTEGNAGGNFISYVAGLSSSDPNTLFANTALRFGTATNKDLTGFKEIMRIDSLGWVGIGIGSYSLTDVNYKLVVNSGIRAKKIKIEATGWPDYVFDDSYKLKDLRIVEDYININKHLPDVPSAKDIELNGINVGDNQVLLLKKIEELTLYLIGQQKQIDSLRNEIKMVKRIK